MVTGKCYQSNKKSYHQIRYQSDKLCKDNNLSVIDAWTHVNNNLKQAVMKHMTEADQGFNAVL